MIKYFCLLLPALFTACASIPDLPTAGNFPTPPAPDYRNSANWAALPTTDDPADRTPGDSLRDQQLAARADVFFLHPTIYRKTRKNDDLWNANLRDEKLNESVDQSTILNQASIFNAAGKIYAPRYRQANLNVYYDEGKAVKQQALDTAYADVLAAFDYYVNTYNRGRPIIIAAHSQGTNHAERLLEDRFDGKALNEQLVAAYLVGMPIPENRYANIPVCESATQTGCFVSWRTYREDFEVPEDYENTNIAVVNPLTWTTEPERAPATLNQGGVLLNYDKEPERELVWAEIRGEGLFTNKPSFFGDIFFRIKNYHIADYNFFWVNVRENAVARVAAFQERNSAPATPPRKSVKSNIDGSETGLRK